jgi:hypothetical protein
MVMSAHDRLCGPRGRHDEGGNGTEAEEHQAVAAMLGGEVTEGDVREVADEVKVADDGQPWRRRQVLSLCRSVVIAAAAATAAACP